MIQKILVHADVNFLNAIYYTKAGRVAGNKIKDLLS